MRIGLASVALLIGLILAGCPQMGGNNNGDGVSGRTTLAVTVEQPTTNTSIAAGTAVTVRWSAVNETGMAGSATVFVESLDDLTTTTIAAGVAVDGVLSTRTVTWDTTGFGAGVYSIRARIEAGESFREDTGTGRVTIDATPTFTFAAPSEDTELMQDGTVDVMWSGADAEGNGRVVILVDPDDDNDNNNEVVIAERSLGETSADDQLAWDGTGQDGNAVDAGTYRVVARVNDGVNAEQTFVADGRITVPEPEDETPTGMLAVTEPAEDASFLTTDDPFEIAFDIDQADDVLVDLKIDTDDNHANGNEMTILSQRLIEAGTESDTFDWDGDDSGGTAVDDGIYRVFLVSFDGTGTPETVEAAGLLFRRSSANQPLIALQMPATTTTVMSGAFINIQWRDDDPGEDALIRLTLDDDNMPAEGTETDNAEIEILADRDASADGVQDSFAFQVTNSLAPGTYFLFAYIDSNPGDLLADHVSVAPGIIIVDDPTDPN